MANFIDDRDLNRDQRLHLLQWAWELKHGRALLDPQSRCLQGREIALYMTKPSLRTRVSFTVAIRKLGGNVIELGPQSTKLGKGEDMEEWAAVLGSMVDAIVARVHEHAWFDDLVKYAGKPVVNALSDTLHPCQGLADAFTVWENARLRGDSDAQSAASFFARPQRWAWIGDGNNVAHSLMLTCASLGVQLGVASPAGYEPSAAILQSARTIHPLGADGIVVGEAPQDAVAGASAVFTDVWVSMGEEATKGGAAAQATRDAFVPYRVNQQLMNKAKGDAIFMHCLPAEPGNEVTSDVLRGPQSRVLAEAENRLWTTLALLSQWVFTG
jgi:ornithine carbamoyltransferase